MHGADRYDVKARAGWTRTRADGSDYDRDVDTYAAEAESWFAIEYGGMVDERVQLRGDEGFDVVLERRGIPLKVDVIHAGCHADGTPRDGRTSHVIVNPDANKLLRADLLVYVDGPPYRVVGGIYTARFLALAQLRDHGFGPKLSLHASRLFDVDTLLGRRRRHP